MTMAGLRALITGATPSEISQGGDVTVSGDVRAAEALLAALSAPPVLEGLRRRLELQVSTAAPRADGRVD